MPATVWKGYLSFGLVSFPVRLYAAARPETVHFHMLHAKDDSRVKEVWYCAEEDKPISRDEIVKGYEYEKGQYIEVTSEDLEKIAPPTATVMEIQQFVKAGEVDPIFLEKSYYVAPEEAVSKPYGLLLTAMSDTKMYAIAKVTMHGREHVVIIRPTGKGMVLHTMYYVDELRAANQSGGEAKGGFSAKEVDMAKKLIDTLAAPFKPAEYHDTYRENVEKLIEAKQKGRRLPTVKQPKPAPVVDMLEALQRSLKAAGAGKKPAPAKKARRAA
ncbi:MAG TPA: Ku protein [Bryobacteraceae bacterium]|nr:Ku protein [Bryobacteraceae bacterium]